MVTSEIAVPGTEHWSERELADEYHAYLALSDAELETEFRSIIRAEHALPEPIRYEATLRRLRAWLALAWEDARTLARAHADALAKFPEPYVVETQAA